MIRLTVIEISSFDATMVPDLLELWGAAVGDRHPLPAAIRAELLACDHSFGSGSLWVATVAGVRVGFVLTRSCGDLAADLVSLANRGWIVLMAVHPAHQRRGVGSALLRAAEAALRSLDVSEVRLGESFHHAVPGIPASLPEARAFFGAHGYVEFQEVWDVRGDVKGHVPPSLPAGIVARALVEADAMALLAFLAAQFPGRWRHDMAWTLDTGRPITDVLGLVVDDALHGFVQLHPPGAIGALRWAGFEPRVAALGPIGVSGAVRGRGLGLALLRAGLAELSARGAGTTVIDWTTLVDFYGRVNFRPWLGYHQARKELA